METVTDLPVRSVTARIVSGARRKLDREVRGNRALARSGSMHDLHDRGENMAAMDKGQLRTMKVSAEQGPAVYCEICNQLADFWGSRDVQALHHPMWLRQFVSRAVIVRHGDLLVGYLLGALASAEVAYIHLVATRCEYQGLGIGRRLYAHFLSEAADHGARTAQAVTAPDNAGSIAFHRHLGFQAETIVDYAGPGRDRVFFQRDLSARR